MAPTESRQTIRIGVFMPADSQLLDMACVDVLGTMSYGYLSMLQDQAPPAIKALAPNVQISYVSTVQPGALIPLTSAAHLKCTHHLSDPAVQPGQFEIVVVPGPNPFIDWAADEGKREAIRWLAAQAAAPGTDILSICTGAFLCGEAGLLKGRKACGPRGLQGLLASKFEGVEWVGEELRWVRDGNVWSSGGVTNGNDLIAAYARLSGRFPEPVVELGLAMTETGDRPQRYETGKDGVDLENRVMAA